MAIEVQKDSWHFRMYRWWYQAKYGATKFHGFVYDTQGFVKEDEEGNYLEVRVPNEPQRTNLCPYMRAILFWSWMRFFFIKGKIKRFPVPLAVWGLILFEIPRIVGIFSYDVKRAIYFTYFGLGCGLLAVTVINLIEKIAKAHHKTISLPSEPNKFIKGVSEFKNLVSEYLRSAHDRVCPEITVKGAK